MSLIDSGKKTLSVFSPKNKRKRFLIRFLLKNLTGLCTNIQWKRILAQSPLAQLFLPKLLSILPSRKRAFGVLIQSDMLPVSSGE
jgi:hypothetical protein